MGFLLVRIIYAARALLNQIVYTHTGRAVSVSCVRVLLFLLQTRNGLLLDATSFHLFLELTRIADSGKEMRLTLSITIKGRKPLAPLFLGSFGFLEVTNDRELETGKEPVVDNLVVSPAIARARDVVVGLSLQMSALVQVECSRPLDVVKLKAVLFKDTADTERLDPQQSGKENVEATSGNANQRGALLGVGCCCFMRNQYVTRENTGE